MYTVIKNLVIKRDRSHAYMRLNKIWVLLSMWAHLYYYANHTVHTGIVIIW